MKRIIAALIKSYQKSISPDHSVVFGNSSAMRCRFYPSCSQYIYEAIVRYGVIKGTLKGFWRILRCNPFSKGGVDFV